MKYLQIWLVLSFFAGLALAPSRVLAVTPTEQLQSTIRQVLLAVNGSAGQPAEGQKERLRKILQPRFDWEEMAKRSLGKYWNREASRQDEFIAAFAEFLGNSYFARIGSYKDEKIQFIDEIIDRDQALVKTRIVPHRGEPTAVDYKLYRAGDEWKVYDVVVEDISLVANFRSQFGRILARGSFDDLLKQLRDKKLN